MMRFSQLLPLLCAGVLTLNAGHALAHSVWIEPAPEGRLVVRFAEPGEEFETSPGHLDSVGQPVAFVAGKDDPPRTLTVSKQSDHFLLADCGPGDGACLQSDYAVMTRGPSPGRKPIFYARWQPEGAGAAAPALTLDLVPMGRPGVVRAWFRGKPLPDVAAVLRRPDGTEEELKADANGFLRFQAEASGFYHLSIARHRESLAGFHQGNAYELTSHNAALTWIVP